MNANVALTAYVSHRKDDCRKEDCVKHTVLPRYYHEHKLMPSTYYLESCIAQNKDTLKCTSGFTTQKNLCLTLSATNSGLPCAGGAGSSAAEAASSFKRVACKAVKVFGCTTGCAQLQLHGGHAFTPDATISITLHQDPPNNFERCPIMVTVAHLVA